GPPSFTLFPYTTLFRSMPEELLVRSAFLVYMLPLLAMFISALGVNALNASEPWIIFAAVLGFLAGALWVRYYSDRYIDAAAIQRSEEHTSELQSRENLV